MQSLVRLALVAAAVAGSSVAPALAQSMIPETTAQRYGLTRAWYAQVGSKYVTGTLANVNYDENMVLVQSTRGMLTALDAETGRRLWATQVGSRESASSEPAANDKYVVVVNGSWLFVLDRADGGIVWQKQVSGVPGAGPGVTATHAVVPMVSGMIEAYDLEKGAKQTPWNYRSAGRVLAPPLTTETTVSWTTDQGNFYVAEAAGGAVRYRLETGAAIHARPSSWWPRLFAGSADGFVYALDEKTGRLSWKFPAGEAIFETPLAIDGRVFAVTEFSGMYCLDAETGAPLWHVGDVAQFVAASPTRVYASDRTGKLAILDIRGGTLIGRMPISGLQTKVINSRSDRIFVVSPSCVVQCLHEPQLVAPVVYAPPRPPETEVKSAPKKPAERSLDEPAARPAEPPAAEPPADDFFQSDKPADEPADVANPFDETP